MDAPLTRDAIEADASAKNQAFQLLSDSTRVKILQVLWEAHEPEEASPVRFSDLRERVGADDPGRLNYHLNELRTHFVRRTDDGYVLRESGKRIARVLLSGTAIDDPEIEPVAIDVDCWYCGSETELSYRDGCRIIECKGCEARCVDTFPPGVISKNEVPPSGLLDRTPNQIADADRIWGTHRRRSVMDGVCPECAGPMPVTGIQICGDHQPDEEENQFCEQCGSIFWILVSHVCGVCKYSWRMPSLFYPTRHPAVVAFYHEHGIDFDLATYEQRSHLLSYRQEVLSEDPLRIAITVPVEDDELRLTFDEQMDVVDVER